MQQLATTDEFLEFLLSRKDELDLPSSPPVSFTAKVLSGNINRVLRICLNYCGSKRSFVVKHVPDGGRLERFPSVIFPEDRLQYELMWFRQADFLKPDQSVRPPAVYVHDQSCRTLVMEDFGYGKPLSELLQSGPSSMNWLKNTGRFMGCLHGKTVDNAPVSNLSAEMNRSFVFTLAVNEPDRIKELWAKQFSVTDPEKLNHLTGIQEEFLQEHKKVIAPLLQELEQGFKKREFTAFTHGDLHGQSLIVTSSGSVGIIDAELADSGDPAFDIGTLCGHIWAIMRKIGANAQTMRKYTNLLWKAYASSFMEHTACSQIELTAISLRVNQYAGSEIIRRLIGAAGFPFAISKATKCELLGDAVTLLTQPEVFNILKEDRVSPVRQFVK